MGSLMSAPRSLLRKHGPFHRSRSLDPWPDAALPCYPVAMFHQRGRPGSSTPARDAASAGAATGLPPPRGRRARLPRVDDRLAPSETRVEYIDGAEIFAATQHCDLTYVL